MVIYSIGCSHTYGHCLRNKSLVWSNIIMRSFSQNYTSFGINFGKLNKESIKNSTDIFVNDSVCGAGNDFIYHTTLENVTLLIDENKKPDYVFIQWSGPNRREYCTPDGNIIYVNLFDNVEQGIKFEPMGSQHTIHYMYSLQEFLKSNNIKYNFFNYFGLDHSIKNLNVFGKIDFSNFLNFGMGENFIYEGLIEYMIKNDYSCDEYGHPNEDGNYFIANHLADKIGVDVFDKNNNVKNII